MQNGERQITEITKRNVVDSLALNRVNWSGRFEEQQFLARLYNLSEMPSTDRQYKTVGRHLETPGNE